MEYVIIFIEIDYHIYWNILPYLMEYCHPIYWNMQSYLLEYAIIFIGLYHTIFIGICHHIYLLLNSNIDKNYIQNITSVKFLIEYLQTTAKTLINKRNTSELFNISEFCFIISQYSYGLTFIPGNLKHYVYV